MDHGIKSQTTNKIDALEINVAWLKKKKKKTIKQNIASKGG
jgi:hypothetical protein